MKLLVTEKPSVAVEFAKALKLNDNIINSSKSKGFIEDNGWIITWCYGHLVTMSYPEKYDEKLKKWDLTTLPFLPKEYKYEVIENGLQTRQFNIIKGLMQRQDVEAIYNAGDSGREGEYIQRLVMQMANPNPNADLKRVWIDSQTVEEVLRGIREAKPMSEYDSLSDSAYLRAKEDYLIGINFSRLLSIIYGRRLAKDLNEERVSIAVGRVMTCVLGMIVSREREIRNFVKTKYYKLNGIFGSENSSFKAEWKVQEKSKVFESPKLYNESGFKKEQDAKGFILDLKDKQAIIQEVKKSKQKENAPLLFNLAEIQNECTRNFKIKPDETLEIIQDLYEKKLVTYPRTDARVLSTAIAKEISKNLNGIYKGFKDEECHSYIQKMIDEKYSTKLEKTKYVNDSKITDHYAIIPTGQGYENYDKLKDLSKNVYKLIVKRFLAIFYPPAEYNKVQVSILVDGTEEFFASGRVLLNAGYQEILKKQNKELKSTKDSTESEDGEEKEEQQEDLEILKNLKKGQDINVLNYEIKEAETTPPTRYNSGSIILAMENAGKLIEDEELREQIKGAGIGTSATRGEIIKKLERIGYMQINNKTQIITPTDKGEKIYDVVTKTIPDMLNPELTASWEKGLDMVAKQDIEPNVFMQKLEKYIKSKFDKLVFR